MTFPLETDRLPANERAPYILIPTRCISMRKSAAERLTGALGSSSVVIVILPSSLCHIMRGWMQALCLD
jgi:hypothetical protein